MKSAPNVTKSLKGYISKVEKMQPTIFQTIITQKLNVV